MRRAIAAGLLALLPVAGLADTKTRQYTPAPLASPFHYDPEAKLRKLSDVLGSHTLTRLPESVELLLRGNYVTDLVQHHIKTMDGKDSGSTAMIFVPKNENPVFEQYALLLKDGKVWGLRYKLPDGRTGYFIDDDKSGLRLHLGMDVFFPSISTPAWVNRP